MSTTNPFASRKFIRAAIFIVVCVAMAYGVIYIREIMWALGRIS